MTSDEMLKAAVALLNTHELKLEYLKEKVQELEEIVEAIAFTHNNLGVAVSKLAHELKDADLKIKLPQELLTLSSMTIEQKDLPNMETLNGILERSKVETPEGEEDKFDKDKLLDELCEAIKLEGPELQEFRDHFAKLFDAAEGNLIKMGEIVEALNSPMPKTMNERPL